MGAAAGPAAERPQVSRQYGVGVYILDFYCPTCCLTVELDGGSHASPEAHENDAERTKFLSTLNIRVLRFPNATVYRDIFYSFILS